jgi:hypothetical protein
MIGLDVTKKKKQNKAKNTLAVTRKQIEWMNGEIILSD